MRGMRCARDVTIALGLLAIGAAGAGCARLGRGRPPASPPGPAVETRQAALRNGWISVKLEIPPGPPGPRPAIVSPLGDRAALLGRGLALVTYRLNWPQVPALAPPPPPPGRTVGVWLLASPTPRLIGRGYFGLIAATADALPHVLDYLATVPEIDVGRIGISGSSTHGFTAFSALLLDRRFRAAVIVAACGDYHEFLHGSNLAMNGEPLDLDPRYDAWLRAHEPVEHPERIVPTPLLMINGGRDLAVPASCATRTEGVLRRAYALAGVPERFAVAWRAQATHNNAFEGAASEAMTWWERWLLDRDGHRSAAARRAAP
jgi:dienelactone hydrolase